MRFAMIEVAGRAAIARVAEDGAVRALFPGDGGYPGALADLVTTGRKALDGAWSALAGAPEIDAATVRWLAPLPNPPKIVCIGLNYADHAAEAGGRGPPPHPTVFSRFPSSLLGHGEPIIRPDVSGDLDYEGELVAVIGRGGAGIAKASALDHVIGYSVFNDASIRDYQMRTSQWTLGKNFDATGAFGPSFVTADELPPGAAGLSLETRLNGQVVQKANTKDLLLDIATLVSDLSQVFAWQPGDIIVTGTPAGVGMARKPPLWMKAGDVCEVEIEGVGLLSNPIANQAHG